MTLEAEKETAYATINAQHAGVLNAATGNASAEERDTWPVKEAAARNFIAGQATADDLDMIQSEIGFTGEDILGFCHLILQKSEQFKHLVGVLSGLRRKYSADVDAATDTNGINTALAAYGQALASISE